MVGGVSIYLWDDEALMSLLCKGKRDVAYAAKYEQVL